MVYTSLYCNREEAPVSFRKAYTFDDVALVPQFNNVPSRTEPLLETWVTRNLKMDIPIICATTGWIGSHRYR